MDKGELAPEIRELARLLAKVRLRVVLEADDQAAPPIGAAKSDEANVQGPPGKLRLLLRTEEVADALGISRTKVYQLIQSGEIPSIHIGRSVRVSVDDLRTWIRDQRER